tara:strand:- start:200 stop:475 length:276 start_codon:yes stop_codon:yes gene_type:complete
VVLDGKIRTQLGCQLVQLRFAEISEDILHERSPGIGWLNIQTFQSDSHSGRMTLELGANGAEAEAKAIPFDDVSIRDLLAGAHGGVVLPGA